MDKSISFFTFPDFAYFFKDFQDKLLDDPRLLALTKIKVKSKTKKAVNTERQELEQIVKFLLSKPKSSFWVEKVTDRLI